MATYSKEFLSGSTNGAKVRATATGSSLDTIHSTGISNTIKDEIWLYASNPNAFDINLYILIGGDNFTNDVAFYGTIEAYAGNVLICPGLILRGDGAAALNVKGNVSNSAGINIFGYVNRITP